MVLDEAVRIEAERASEEANAILNPRREGMRVLDFGAVRVSFPETQGEAHDGTPYSSIVCAEYGSQDLLTIVKEQATPDHLLVVRAFDLDVAIGFYASLGYRQANLEQLMACDLLELS